MRRGWLSSENYQEILGILHGSWEEHRGNGIRNHYRSIDKRLSTTGADKDFGRVAQKRHSNSYNMT